MEKKKLSASMKCIGAFTLFFMLLSAGHVMAASKPKPTLNLFPSDVTEYLTRTGATAKNMEGSLKGVIQKLETQRTLYEQTGCEGSGDPGCAEMTAQMGDTYLEFLGIIEDSLPAMKSSVRATNKGIEKNLRREVGKKTSPADIQRLLSDNGKPEVFNGRYSLSSRFAKYHAMITRGGSTTLATLASEIYLDSGAVLNMIGMMEAEIPQQRAIIELGRLYGTLTPEMVETVDAIKEVIFGEVEEDSVLPVHQGGEVGTFQSTLEME